MIDSWRDVMSRHPRHLALVVLSSGLVLAGRVELTLLGMVALAVLGVQLRRGVMLACVLVVLVLAGSWVGSMRVAAIDRNSLGPLIGRPFEGHGYLVRRERPVRGQSRFRVELRDGRGVVQVRGDRMIDASLGDELLIAGRMEQLPQPSAGSDFDYGAYLRRSGVGAVLRAARIEPTGRERGGLAGVIDELRRRSEQGIAAGLPPDLAALARGMVLGQDELISERTSNEFKASGLAHLLAVSGQNVTLLALLAFPLLGLVGVARRGRLAVVLILIAIYVPLTGAGPSIVRAGIMGAAATVAALSGRPASRWYALLLALACSSAFDPRAWMDVGWQLSFAAVAGIFLLVGPLKRRMTGWPAWLAEGAATTIAATLATAPLLAFQFGQVSLVSVLANLIVLPAVAPVMWLGMLSAAVGQVSVDLAGLLNALNGYCIAYVAEIASVTAKFPAATFAVEFDDWRLLVASYALPASLVWLWLSKRGERGRRHSRSPWVRVAVALSLLVGLAVTTSSFRGSTSTAAPSFRMSFFDVGQGDAALIQTPGGANVLVDTGPPGTEIVSDLRGAGVDRIDLMFLTHPQADHVGAARGLFPKFDVKLLVDGGPPPSRPYSSLLSEARDAGVRLTSATAGESFRLDGLVIRVLNPREVDAAADPNAQALVLLVSYRGFDALLAADAETEATGTLWTSPVELLKVAHHGSADAGLRSLLAKVDPRLAVLSVGAGNTYGHPDPSTMAVLSSVPGVLRTDRGGDIEVRLERGRIEVGRQ